MLARLRNQTEEDEGGFTLIELLVVIIIIGILAAIAIPVFLNQRNKGYDAAAKSDARNAATLEETYLTDKGFYSAQADATAAPLSAKKSPSTSLLSVKTYTDASHSGPLATDTTPGTTGQSGAYCVKATSQSGTSFYYDSAVGGFTTTACP